MWQVLTGFEPTVLMAFIGAGLLLNITPGVDFVFVATNGIMGGPRVGVAAAIGINIGITLHILAAAAGVSAILAAQPNAYLAIKLAGAAYLLYLAYQSWQDTGELASGRAVGSPWAAIKRGFFTNVLNPKTALFIFAFIPQFTAPGNGPVWMQILVLGAIFQFFGLLFVVALGAFSGAFSSLLRSKVKFLNKITALVFGGIAAKLIID